MSKRSSELLVTLNSSKTNGTTKIVGGANGCAICDSRVLWLDHGKYTRETAALIILKAPKKALEATVSRLLRNPEDMGKWFAQVLGDTKTGDAVAGLLTEHLKQAVPIVEKLRDGRPASEINPLVKQWQQNANDIANALYAIAQQYGFTWQLSVLKESLLHHLKLVTKEVKQFIAGDYAGAIQTEDENQKALLGFSDMLVKGTKASCKCGGSKN